MKTILSEPRVMSLPRLIASLALLCLTSPAGSLDSNFRQPPPESRPWVYWFWLNGNITSNGITADLEAMKRVGIGGVLIMEVDQGAPVGPADFMSDRWRDLFKHVHAEARRLGFEVNMNNDAGWNGSGGPWIKPEQSMQEVVWTETNVAGPQHFEGKLAQPEARADFYRDIAVQAFPTVGDYRIPNIEVKAAFQKRSSHKPSKAEFAPEMIIAHGGITNLTARMDTAGRLVWDVPPGQWTVVRFGHTSTGVENAPAPKSGGGLECDKLSREGIEANFAGMMAKLSADNGLKPGKQNPVAADVSRLKYQEDQSGLTSAATFLKQGSGLVATHIDSWENGTQNWTAKMREEFQQRRGYDLLPFLPVMTGRVVGSLEISERFLWDLRQTISELIIENYASHMRELAHAAGMRFTVEAYGGPCDSIPYAGQSDEPMGEFWTPGGSAMEACRVMASAAHVHGKRIVGAEAFTSAEKEKWREHPATIKAIGDRAFCEGINRFVFHRYALQPWAEERRPGMMMGPWGQHYERTQTWWEWTPAWHEYLARCQFMLRQGLFVADICYLQPEAPPQGPGDHKRGGYAWDECTAEAVLTRMSVKEGRIVLPDGMNYRVLVLPQVETMTPALLRKIKELVQAGATVVGPPPTKSPSLAGYPQCDEAVKQLANEIWKPGEAISGAQASGQGRVVWGAGYETLLAKNAAKNPVESAKWIWHQEGNPAAAAPPGERSFRRVVTLEVGRAVATARMAMTADNSFELRINGQLVGTGEDFNQLYSFDVARWLKPGANLIAVTAFNAASHPNPAGLIGALHLRFTDGSALEIATDKAWVSATVATEHWTTNAAISDGWVAALELGALGMEPWGVPGRKLYAPFTFPDSGAVANLLANLGVPPDFESDATLSYIHRRDAGADMFFVANPRPYEFAAKCSFRVTGKVPELWWPDSGRIERAAMWEESGGVTRVVLPFEPSGSVFVVFRERAGKADPLVSLRRDGVPVLPAAPGPRMKVTVLKARYGVLDDPKRTRDVREKLQRLVDTGENSFKVAQMAGGDDPAVMVVKTLDLEYALDGEPHHVTGQDPESINLMAPIVPPKPVVEVHRDARGSVWLETREPGEYDFVMASGRTGRVTVKSAAISLEVGGPWQVRFAPNWGAPSEVRFDQLISWSDHSDPGVKYFSGEATYAKTITVPREMLAKGKRLYLDLGQVQAMARVKLNGKNLGVLWKPPFRADLTSAAKPGDNKLEIQVVNLWPNRMIGDEQLPEDSERNPEGTLKKWPQWLVEGQPSPSGRYTFAMWRLWKKNDALLESGLIGPVNLQAVTQTLIR